MRVFFNNKEKVVDALLLKRIKTLPKFNINAFVKSKKD
jgi:hypothetical protein